jgi:quercetin dioxygenase-like cupin family protein
MAPRDYFDAGPVHRDADAVGRFTTVDEQQPIEAAPGVVLRAVAGTGVMLSYVTVSPNSEAAVHAHDEEQMGIVIAGTCTFELDGETRRLGRGDVYVAPPGVPHGLTTAAEECVVIDVFSPPRQALLDLLDDVTD